MGYYPTPLSVVERIRSFLRFPEENVNVLDPCCGEGMALKNLVEGAKATTYAIELDGHRAEQAKHLLHHVLKCSCDEARMSNDAFSCLFLNPPYDWGSSPADEVGSERKEKSFLRGTLNYLQPEGVLVYIVPQKSVTSDVAKVLSYRFDDFNTYRFPDEDYERFRQIVLFGKKKREKALNEDSFERLSAVPWQHLEGIPYLETPIYDLPPSPEVKLFRSSVIDQGELERELRKSGLWEKLRTYGRNSGNNLGRPPLPLHTGHLGLLLASGCLDGIVGDGEDKHIVRGKAEKVTYTEQEEYDGEVLVERERESYRVSIKVLKKDGEILTLM